MQGHAACAQLVQNGGVAQLLSQRGSYIQAEPAVDSNAVRDSLECLAGIAAASPEGARACLESEATQAASMVLQVLLSGSFNALPFSHCCFLSRHTMAWGGSACTA